MNWRINNAMEIICFSFKGIIYFILVLLKRSVKLKVKLNLLR